MWEPNCCKVKVMIVSPSDVPKKQREIVKNALYHWNEVNFRSNIVFSVLGYDINAHADVGDHPQELLNHQLLEQADILIAIFGTELGTPTKEYSSGSVEEISKHIEKAKRALIYFSTAPIPRNADFKQYEELQKYKKSIKDKVFYKEFSTEEEFEKKLTDDIDLIAQELDGANSLHDIKIKYGTVHIKIRETEKGGNGTAIVTYHGSSLVDAPHRPVMYRDRVRALPDKIIAQEFEPKATIVNEYEFKQYSNDLVYELELKGSNDEPLYYIGDVVVSRKMQAGNIGLNIPYDAVYLIVNVDMSEAPFIQGCKWQALLKYGSNLTPIDKTFFSKLSKTYTIRVDNVKAGSNIVFCWKNDEV